MDKKPKKSGTNNENSQEQRFTEVTKLIIQTAKAKGWFCQVSAQDEKNFRYATLEVSRGGMPNEVTGNLELTCDGGVKLSVHGTSFYKYGLNELQDAVWNEICKLPWLEKPKSKNQQPSMSHTGVEIIERFLRRFHRVARQVKHRHADRPGIVIKDEYDVQDILYAFFRGMFDDVRAEEVSPSYAGGSSRVDFLLKSEKIVIEVKLTSASLKDKQVGEQLLIDIGRYRAHPDCKRLVCFVYDPDSNLKNPSGLESDLSKADGEIEVKVIVVSP